MQTLHFVWAGLVTDGEGGRVWNVRERKGEGGLHLRAQLESSVSAAAATTLPQRNMDLLFSLCSAAHFSPKSHLKLFQFRTRDARRRIWVYFEAIFLSVKLRSRFVRLSPWTSLEGDAYT